MIIPWLPDFRSNVWFLCQYDFTALVVCLGSLWKLSRRTGMTNEILLTLSNILDMVNSDKIPITTNWNTLLPSPFYKPVLNVANTCCYTSLQFFFFHSINRQAPKFQRFISHYKAFFSILLRACNFHHPLLVFISFQEYLLTFHENHFSSIFFERQKKSTSNRFSRTPSHL